MDEKTYHPHQLRVLQEKQDLGEKITKLRAFIDSDAFINTVNEVESLLLQQQLVAMMQYDLVLQQRILIF